MDLQGGFRICCGRLDKPSAKHTLSLSGVPWGFAQKKGWLAGAEGVAQLAGRYLGMHEAPGFSIQYCKEKKKSELLSFSFEWWLACNPCVQGALAGGSLEVTLG